jgi:hypothetical protein
VSLITDKPENLPSGDAEDATLLEDEIDVAYLTLSATNVKLESPPELGESLTLVIHGKCTATGEKENKDGEIRNVRTITVTSAHKPGKRPVEDPNQGALFSHVVTADSDEMIGDGDSDEG